MDLSELGEWGFLERVRGWVPSGDAIVGLGDDAAVVPVAPGASVVATTDALVDGVHFRLDWSSPSDVGFKAAVVNVSDLAAMGAVPRWLLLALAAPGDISEGVLKGLYEGLVQGCSTYGMEFVGGDTVRADQLTLAVTALGELDGPPLRRTGAEPGDVLGVTGTLGRAAAGVNLLLSQDPRDVTPDDALACIGAHRRPVARVAEGQALRRAGAHAVLDVSDGLLADVRRLAEASGVGVEVDAERVPIAGEARRVAEARGWDVFRMALGGGEDFELLTAAAPDVVDALGLLPLGRVVPDGLWLVRDGQREPLPEGGHDHFRV